MTEKETDRSKRAKTERHGMQKDAFTRSMRKKSPASFQIYPINAVLL
jgi:hypothetical protein